MKKLTEREIQQGKVFHGNGQSVKVLMVETRESESGPVQVVVFREIGNNTGERALKIEDFCKQYQRKKR